MRKYKKILYCIGDKKSFKSSCFLGGTGNHLNFQLLECLDLQGEVSIRGKEKKSQL